jgi:hypothetical protein
MDNVILISEFLIVALVAGLAGTAGMTGFMNALTKKRITNADMIRAIGSALTRNLESSLLVGALLHFISGTFFAIIYTLCFGLMGLTSLTTYMFVGLCMGFVHGFVLSFILIIVIAEHHPLPQFREPGFGTAVAHLVGHVLYGLIVGAVVGLSQIVLPPFFPR